VNIARPTAVEPGLAARLEAATVAHRDAQEVAANAAATWRKLIVEAIDAGVPQKLVATLARVSTARVHAIVVGEYSKP
jgi:hypothetical protein